MLQRVARILPGLRASAAAASSLLPLPAAAGPPAAPARRRACPLAAACRIAFADSCSRRAASASAWLLLSLPLGLAAKLLELTRRLLELVGERALRRRRRPAALLSARARAAPRPAAAGAARAPSAARPARRPAAGLLLLLLRALLRLVLVRHAVQLRAGTGRPALRRFCAATATAAAAATAAALLDFELVELLGFLQELERAALAAPARPSA